MTKPVLQVSNQKPTKEESNKVVHEIINFLQTVALKKQNEIQYVFMLAQGKTDDEKMQVQVTSNAHIHCDDCKLRMLSNMSQMIAQQLGLDVNQLHDDLIKEFGDDFHES